VYQKKEQKFIILGGILVFIVIFLQQNIEKRGVGKLFLYFFLRNRIILK